MMVPMMSWLTAGWLLLALLLVTAGVAVAAVMATVNRPPAVSGPEEQLRVRYARGEIGDEEYRNRLAVLRATREVLR